jgi:GAF domain-containing protein
VDEANDERRRYTTRLQRKAQAYVTQELGDGEVERVDVDRQVAMLIQHALEATGARRVTLLRPVSRSQRWHTVTLLNDGGFYYGLIAPESLVLPMVAFAQRKPVMLGPNRPHEIPAPRVSELGFRSYLGLPLLRGDQVLAVLEVVDVDKGDLLEEYSTTLQQALQVLVEALADAREQAGERIAITPRNSVITETTVLDLVLRPPINEDDTIAIDGDEWLILAQIDGTRTLAATASAASVPLDGAHLTVASLLERGLIRIGREERRR